MSIQMLEQGAHLETEKGFRITKSEYNLLTRLLPLIGFSFINKSRLTDFLVPTTGETTKRMRIERILKSASGELGLHCIRCSKSHPIAGAAGKNVRREVEKHVTPMVALSFILRAIERHGAPIPYYTKKRSHFQGVYEGYPITIALDKAVGLGRFSGYYMEIETILPMGSEDVSQALSVIDALAKSLLNEKRAAKISYRKMLMMAWVHDKLSGKKLKGAQANYGKLIRKESKIGAKKASSNQAPAKRAPVNGKACSSEGKSNRPGCEKAA